MRAVRDGDPASFAALFQRYREPIWRFVRRRVTESSTAEELAQDIFAALLEAAPRYEPRGSFRSYLFGIAYNVLKANRRRSASVSSTLEADGVPAESANADAVIWVRRALAELDADEREILMLRE